MGLFVRCYSYGVHRDVISTGRKMICIDMLKTLIL